MAQHSTCKADRHVAGEEPGHNRETGRTGAGSITTLNVAMSAGWPVLRVINMLKSWNGFALQRPVRNTE